jgi:hypothetical protein
MKKGAAGNFYSMMPETLMKKYSLSCFCLVIIIFFRCPQSLVLCLFTVNILSSKFYFILTIGRSTRTYCIWGGGISSVFNKGRQFNEVRTEKEKSPERFINGHLGLQIYKMTGIPFLLTARTYSYLFTLLHPRQDQKNCWRKEIG